nr:zinc finger, CCHC-type, retrotransposon Gag domain protein [Tanacetum cinerariifolium]
MMANLSDSEDLQCAGFDYDHYQEAACAYHEEHMMHDCVQIDHVVNSHDEYTSDSNIIMCDRYVRDNEVPVVHSGASCVPTDDFMMIYDDITPRTQYSAACQFGGVTFDVMGCEDALKTRLAVYKFKGNALAWWKAYKQAKGEQAKNFQWGLCKSTLNHLMCMSFTDVAQSRGPSEGYSYTVCTTCGRRHLGECRRATEFDQTCKKRITPSAITNGERGFEQTKACYLKEVISFFKTLKDNFEGIQKALTKEVKEMKDVFEELEAEALEAELSNLRETKNQDNQTELINHFSKLEITRAKHIKQVTKLIAENVKLRTSISKAKVQPSGLTRTKHAVDVELIVLRLRNNKDAHLDYLRHLKESMETIRDIVEEAKVIKPLDRSIVSACRYTKHSQELLEYAIGTCPHGSQPRAKQLIPLIKKKQKTDVPVPPSSGVDSCPVAGRSKPMNHVKLNRIVPAKGNACNVFINMEKEGHSDCDSKHSVHQADHPPSSEEAQVPPKTQLSTPPANEEPVLGYLKFSAKGTKREIFGIPIPGRLIMENIREASYYQEYQENVAKHRGFLDGETRSSQDLPAPKPAKPARKPQSTAQKAPLKSSISSPVTSTQPVPTSVPAKTKENKRKHATRITNKPAKAKRIKRSVSRKTRQSRSSPKSVGESEAEEGPLPPVVIREPESGKCQPLPEVLGKGKAKVFEEQVAHDLLSLQKHKKTSPADQYIFQRRVSEPTASSFYDVSP